MKIFIPILLYFVFANSSFATVIVPSKNPSANEVMIKLPDNNKTISLLDFTTLSPKKYKELTGRKLNLTGKIKLKISQRFAKRMIQKDGTVNMDNLKKRSGFFDRWEWHWGGFALGFLIVLGPIIALFFKDDYKWDRFWTAMKVNGILLAILGIVAAATL